MEHRVGLLLKLCPLLLSALALHGADAVCLLLRLLHNGGCLALRVCHDPVGKLLRLLVCCMDLCQILIRRRLRRLKHPFSASAASAIEPAFSSFTVRSDSCLRMVSFSCSSRCVFCCSS